MQSSAYLPTARLYLKLLLCLPGFTLQVDGDQQGEPLSLKRRREEGSGIPAEIKVSFVQDLLHAGQLCLDP